MKKITAITLLVLVMFGLLSGCAPADTGNEAGSDGTEEVGETGDGGEETEVGAKPFKYGLISWGTADEHGRTLTEALKWAVEAAGGEFLLDGTAISAETTIAAAENLIQSGANMISFCTYAGEATVPVISNLCQENGVYWTMWDTTISDPEIQALIDEDPYFVGTTNEDQYTSGYETMKNMIEQGATKVIVFKYGVNIPTCDDRVAGAQAAADEFGAEFIYEVVAPDDYAKAAQDAITANPEADAAFMAGAGQQAPAVAAAYEAAGIEDYVLGIFDYGDQMGEMFKNGQLNISNGGHMVTATFSALMAINSYYGTPLSDAKYQVTIPYLTLSSYDDYLIYKEYASEGAAYTSEELQQMLKVNNPDLTLEDFQAFVSNWSVADIAERKGE
jgi:hypothetical protein